MLLSASEIRKRFRNALAKDVSLQAIHYVASRLGYHQKMFGGKKGYDKSLYTALTQHFKDLVDYDAKVAMKARQKPNKQPNLGDYYTYNGERDNVDYEWEKNENMVKRPIIESKGRLTILWLDDQRDPYKYLNTKSKSNTFMRNKAFYDDLMKQYDVNFVWVKNLYQFKEYIENNGLPQFISFDHDLNNRGGGEGLSDEEKLVNNGLNCAKWLVNYCKQTRQPLPKFYVHSANPKHGPEINAALNSRLGENVIRLTQSDIHEIVKECVSNILKECKL